MSIPEAPLNFGALDYSMFALMLVVSVAVGVWFGVCGRRKNTAVVDYLMGGKSMAIFPVGVSLVASHISGITLMGVPSEIYIHGVQYILVCIVAFIMGLIIDFVYLPVFYDLQLTSTYEYLQLRFNRSARLMASFLFTLQLVLFIPIVVYVPSLAFGQVSGVNLHVISPIVCVICIFYTMLGGLKAVVWTDFLQAFVMVGALIAVMIIGVIRVGGVGRVWELNAASGRLDLDWNPNPFVRNTVWATVVGTTFTWLCGCAVNQGTMQKFLSLPTRPSTHKAIILFSSGICLMKFLSSYSGLIIYANYYNCDPLKTQAISRPDQLLPLFVMDTTGNIPGLPGLFIAGVFSAALSSMSSALNSLAGTLYEDFVSPCLSGKLTELQVNLVMKTIVGLVGAICVGLVFVVERLGAVLELGYSIGGITGGALLGLFTLGILFPWANSKGALAGSISSLLFMGWLVLGAQHAHVTGQIHDPWFPSSTDGCGFNVTLAPGPDKHGPVSLVTQEPLLLYRLSYLYYGMAGTLCVLAVGLPVSLLTGGCRVRDVRLLAPFVRRLLRRKERYPAEGSIANANAAAEKELLAMGARE